MKPATFVIVIFYTTAVVAPVAQPQPGAGKQGTCPTTTQCSTTSITRDCVSDSQCSEHLKCCRKGCQQTCVYPVIPYTGPKAGSCPSDNGICGKDTKSTCTNDSYCRSNLKCCKRNCRYSCQYTVEETAKQNRQKEIPKSGQKPGTKKLGKCPNNIPMNVGTCQFDPKINCNKDSHCKGNLKCCRDSCGFTCQLPDGEAATNNQEYTTNRTINYGQKPKGSQQPSSGDFAVQQKKEGACPQNVEANVVTCPFNEKLHCAGDAHCKDQLKCCQKGCASTCELPALSEVLPDQDYSVNRQKEIVNRVKKAGTCPNKVQTIVGTCTFNVTINCNEDAHCKDNLKCCRDNCGFTCNLPTGEAQLLGQDYTTNREEHPINDAQRPGQEDSESLMETGNDNPNNRKPITKPGQCKTPPQQQSICSIDATNPCSNDESCSGSQKCCNDGCNLSCQDPGESEPVQEKPVMEGRSVPANDIANDKRKVQANSKCPEKGKIQCAKPGLNSRDCLSDSDCKQGGVCCLNPCGSGCIQLRN